MPSTHSTVLAAPASDAPCAPRPAHIIPCPANRAALLAAMEAAQWAYSRALRALHGLQTEQGETYGAEQRLRRALNRARLAVMRAECAIWEAECAWDEAIVVAMGGEVTP